MTSPLPWKQLTLIIIASWGWGHLSVSGSSYIESGSYIKICHFAIFGSTVVHALVHYSTGTGTTELKNGVPAQVS